MPPPMLASPAQLAILMARRPASSAAELATALQVSVPTLHRLLKRLPDAWISAGKARRARYALARPLRGVSAALPLYAVDDAGRPHLQAQLWPLRPEGSWLDLQNTPWPVPEEARDGWWDGLPYPIVQMRPQGYMGRQFAQAEHRRLQLSSNPQEWSDDDVLFALSQSGSDTSGNLILGDPACEQWLASKTSATDPIPEAETTARYVLFADHAVAVGSPGSSAAGEFPKFTAQRALAGCATPHVIVKFSGREDAAAVQRWSDLLVCEHLAATYAQSMPGIVSARSRILQVGGRTFLEVERFDRHGAFGRSPLCALDALNAALIGESSMDWPRLASRLSALELLTAEDVQRVQRLWWYGQLIGNTDMHLGNLSFCPREGRLDLAPVYDMLPMRYAPLPGGEVPRREFASVLPLPPQREVWGVACGAAIAFWRAAAGDGRIGPEFQRVCTANADALVRLQDHA